MKKLLSSFILWYVRFFARLQIQKTHPIIVGVGGSSGKSSLVRLISQALSSTYAVDTTREKNSETGIPLHILGIHFEFSYSAWVKVLYLAPLRVLFYKPSFDVLIAEMGIDSPVEPKNMSYLLSIIQPSIGVVTNITEEHSTYFDPFVNERDERFRKQKILELTAGQETLLLKSLPSTGVAIINRDDQYILRSQKSIDAKHITISTKYPEVTLFAKEVSIWPNRFETTIVYKEKEYPLIISQALPKHFVYEFLCAIGVGLAMGLSVQDAIEGIQKNFSLPPGRMSIFKGIKNTTIIDSSYNNATMPPLLDMLDFLKTISPTGRKLAIIGDMRELGSQSKAMHEEFARHLMLRANRAILIGPLLRNYAVPILEQRKFSYIAFDTFSQAKAAILKEIQEKDTILVKSSQNTLFLERVVHMLLEDKKDVEKLCRRGEFWDKKREETP